MSEGPVNAPDACVVTEAVRLGFPNTARLRKSREFKLITDRGKKIHTPLFLVFFRKNSLQSSRLGVTVSKKVGQAVTRNRIKRWLREYFRHWQKKVSGHWDVVVIARAKANQVSHVEFDHTLDRAFSTLLP